MCRKWPIHSDNVKGNPVKYHSLAFEEKKKSWNFISFQNCVNCLEHTIATFVPYSSLAHEEMNNQTIETTWQFCLLYFNKLHIQIYNFNLFLFFIWICTSNFQIQFYRKHDRSLLISKISIRKSKVQWNKIICQPKFSFSYCMF